MRIVLVVVTLDILEVTVSSTVVLESIISIQKRVQIMETVLHTIVANARQVILVPLARHTNVMVIFSMNQTFVLEMAAVFLMMSAHAWMVIMD